MIILAVIFIVLTLLFVYSLCKISGDISRMEEAREWERAWSEWDGDTEPKGEVNEDDPRLDR